MLVSAGLFSVILFPVLIARMAKVSENKAYD